MIDTLLLATHNEGKRRELAELLAPLRIRVTSAKDHRLPSPAETGDSFHANAALKAQAALDATGLPCLADDSGLSIAALGGTPGVYTADWAGPERDYARAFARIQAELGPADAAASFHCVLALALPSKPLRYFTGEVQGSLTFPPRGSGGFGYDPVFIPRGHAETFAERPALKQHLSHRALALAQLMEFLQQPD